MATVIRVVLATMGIVSEEGWSDWEIYSPDAHLGLPRDLRFRDRNDAMKVANEIANEIAAAMRARKSVTEMRASLEIEQQYSTFHTRWEGDTLTLYVSIEERARRRVKLPDGSVHMKTHKGWHKCKNYSSGHFRTSRNIEQQVQIHLRRQSVKLYVPPELPQTEVESLRAELFPDSCGAPPEAGARDETDHNHNRQSRTGLPADHEGCTVRH